MAKNISLLGADYPDVPAVQLPQTGGGTATFYDINVIDNLDSDSSTDALSAKQGKELNTKIARMESTQFEESVTINTYTSSSNPYTFPNDGYLMISAGSGTNSLYDVYVIASDSATAVLARLNKRFTEASQVDSLFVRKGTRAYVADRSSSVTVAFREFK